MTGEQFQVEREEEEEEEEGGGKDELGLTLEPWRSRPAAVKKSSNIIIMP